MTTEMCNKASTFYWKTRFSWRPSAHKIYAELTPEGDLYRCYATLRTRKHRVYISLNETPRNWLTIYKWTVILPAYLRVPEGI